jgi:GR25 family glycosyltransferase involved in LPS biosynthesis
MIRIYEKDRNVTSYHDWYLIFEDDITVQPANSRKDFHSYLVDVLRKTPKDADILYLGCVIPRNAKTNKYSKNKMFVRVNYAWQLHAYVLKGLAVDRILKSLPINGPVDTFIGSLLYNKTLVGYALVDKIIIQQGICICICIVYRYLIF